MARRPELAAAKHQGVHLFRKLSIGLAVLALSTSAMAQSKPANTQPRAGAPGGVCAQVRADKINDGRSPAERPFLTARDAVWYNHPDELAALLDDCLGVNDVDQYGYTLLHHAADRDRVAIARILVQRGASRSLRNKDGKTAAALATSAEMKGLLGPAPAAAKPTSAADKRKLECRQKYEADAALASDSTGKMRAMRRWEQCLKTGRYW